MTAPDDPFVILDRIATGNPTEADLELIRQLLTPSGNHNIVQLGKYDVNLGHGQGDIHIGDRIYQGADAETIREIIRAVVQEFQETDKVKLQHQKTRLSENTSSSRQLYLPSRVYVYIAVLLLCLAGGSCIYAFLNPDTTPETSPQTFANQCQKKQNLPEVTRMTINLLLEVANTQDCNKASKQLLSKKELDLGENNPLIKNYFQQHSPEAQTFDLKPIAYLTNLKRLDLSGIWQIQDISPLRLLTKLEYLNLRNTTVGNGLSSLNELPKLTELNLSKCYITDATPLASLKQLTKLNLSETNITDIRPLSSLSNLTELNLSNIRELKNVSPLSSLKNLKMLDLRGSAIENKTCPIPKTASNRICDF